jgi:hypothetical protein
VVASGDDGISQDAVGSEKSATAQPAIVIGKVWKSEVWVKGVLVPGDSEIICLPPRQSQGRLLPPVWSQFCPPRPHDNLTNGAALDRGQFLPIVRA